MGILGILADVRQDRIFNAKQTLVPKIRRLAERDLRRPSSSALAQRHHRFTEESTTRSLKVGCQEKPATNIHQLRVLGQFGSTC